MTANLNLPVVTTPKFQVEQRPQCQDNEDRANSARRRLAGNQTRQGAQGGSRHSRAAGGCGGGPAPRATAGPAPASSYTPDAPDAATRRHRVLPSVPAVLTGQTKQSLSEEGPTPRSVGLVST